MNPKYLFCDEPNSGLDPKTSLVIDDLLHSITQEYNMVETMVNSIAVPAGFMMVLCLFATIRERLSANEDMPRAFQGNPIALVIAAIMAIAFGAFAGMA